MQFTTNEQIILASASPRRKELLALLKIPFEIHTKEVDERAVEMTTPKQYVLDVARLKTAAVKQQFPKQLVIGADTVVLYNQRLLHKPRTHAEAVNHLRQLSEQTHEVMTAVVIIDANGIETTFTETTRVTFRKLSDALIEAYVSSKDPFDKAGGYGIQTSGALLVEKIEGDYNNVVGLPIAKLTEQLLSLNYISI